MEDTAKSKASRLVRLQAQTRAIRFANGILFCVLGLSAGLLVVATAFPQRRLLDEKERELAVILEEENRVIAAKEDKAASLEALHNDREYLELHARDRLNLHRSGEKIYRIERDR